MLSDLFRAGYESYTCGGVAAWQGVPMRYLDYARALRARSFAEEIDYWKGVLDDSELVLHLPTDRPVPAERSQHGAVERLDLGPELSRCLTSFCRSTGLTVPGLFLAVYAMVLGRYCAQDDIIVGTTLLNRPGGHLERVVGFFANTVPLRINLNGDPTVHAVLRRAQDVIFDALEHEATPFQQIVQAVQPSRNLSYSPVFRVMFGTERRHPNPKGPFPAPEL